jgi:hypothetical protein
MNSIRSGARVLVRSASGDLVACRAISDVVKGSNFAIVWVCAEDAWHDGMEVDPPEDVPGSVPCPAEDVSVAEPQPVPAMTRG